MASRTWTPSPSRSFSNSSSSSDATMMDAPPQAPSRPARLRNPSHGAAVPPPMTWQMRPGEAPLDPSFSLLLSLPRELRDRVYTFALVSSSPFWWPGKAPESVPNDDGNVTVALVRTSKQVYKESVHILYSQNTFLFTHPSDCSVFRVVASPASVHMANVYFRIRAKDVKLWTTYLGSKQGDRSLKSDLPKLKSLWVFLRCGLPVQHAGVVVGPGGALAQAHAAQAALGQQMHALQQQVLHLMQAMAIHGAHVVGGGGNHAQPGGSQIPPPPPPAPAMPFLHFAQEPLGLGGHHHHPGAAVPHAHGHGHANHAPNPNPLAQHVHHAPINPQATQASNATTNRPDPDALYSTFLRFEREMGVESLCLNLRDVYRPWLSTSSNPKSSSSNKTSARVERTGKPPDNDPLIEVKIVCILHIPRRELEGLVSTYPQELSVDAKSKNARTRFRELHDIEVSLQLNACPSVEQERGAEG